MKSFEQYETYPKAQSCSPLLFIVMIKLLNSYAGESMKHLKTMTKNLYLSDLKGENVQHLVSLVQGTYKCLKWLNIVSDNIINEILAILQTSSVTEFNEYLKHYKKTVETMQDMSDAGNDMLKHMDLDNLLHIAENKYKSLMSIGKWTRTKTIGCTLVY